MGTPPAMGTPPGGSRDGVPRGDTDHAWGEQPPLPARRGNWELGLWDSRGRSSPGARLRPATLITPTRLPTSTGAVLEPVTPRCGAPMGARAGGLALPAPPPCPPFPRSCQSSGLGADKPRPAGWWQRSAASRRGASTPWHPVRGGSAMGRHRPRSPSLPPAPRGPTGAGTAQPHRTATVSLSPTHVLV